LGNLGIWAAFLCAHRCPFLHTCRIYPNDPQKTWWTTTSNDELGQEGDKIAHPCEEVVHESRHFYIILVRAGVPHLMLHLCQVHDTPQVHWPALAEMCLSAIGKLENPPKYRMAFQSTIVLRRHSNPWCLSIPMKNIPAAINVPCTPQKHLGKCIVLEGSLV
jgi:hypothetical protein